MTPRFVDFLRDPFAGTKEKGNYVDAFRTAVWLSFNLLVSVAVIVGVGYLLIGVPHLPLAEWLWGLVVWAYGVDRTTPSTMDGSSGSSSTGSGISAWCVC